MRILIAALLLASCASGRTLSERERLSLGLTGIIYDARICHRSFEPSSKDVQVDKPCELVTCEPYRKSVKCVAVPENQKSR